MSENIYIFKQYR
jgi:hypothetical protein